MTEGTRHRRESLASKQFCPFLDSACLKKAMSFYHKSSLKKGIAIKRILVNILRIARHHGRESFSCILQIWAEYRLLACHRALQCCAVLVTRMTLDPCWSFIKIRGSTGHWASAVALCMPGPDWIQDHNIDKERTLYLGPTLQYRAWCSWRSEPLRVLICESKGVIYNINTYCKG